MTKLRWWRSALLVTVLLRIHSCQGFTQSRLSVPLPSILRSNYRRSSFAPFDHHKPQRSTVITRASSEASSDEDDKPRPEWALDWMPTWLVTLKPLHQLGVVFVLYVFHLAVLTQQSIVFPFQLYPNNLGHFTSLGLDSVAGIASLTMYFHLRRTTKRRPTPAVPSLLASPTRRQRPWQFPKVSPNLRLPGPKTTGLVALYLLVQGYFMTGQFSVLWEELLYAAAAVGFPMTIPMHRSLVVLMGHLTWIVVGGLILGIVPRPQPFFGGGYEYEESDDDDDEKETNENAKKKKKILRKNQRWFTSTWDTYWVWWAIGGYFVSSWFFNLADFANQMLLPHALFETANEGVVSQLVNPEHNEWFASLIGSLAPCLSAPWWEEILYRGFMLPALCLHLPYWIAVWASGVIFSIHHVSATGAIPLMVLGWTWAALYTKSGNLLVTILVHAMWNSRVFLGNWLGL